MNRTNLTELVGNRRTDGLSLEFQLHELKESRSVMVEKIVRKVTSDYLLGGSDVFDRECEKSHLKDYAMKLAWR